MGELGALFNPGMRHEQEERRSKALQREEEGDSREVDPRIDLESGVAVIPTEDQDAAPASAPRNGSASSAAESAEPDAEAATAAAPARPRPRGKRGLAARSR